MILSFSYFLFYVMHLSYQIIDIPGIGTMIDTQYIVIGCQNESYITLPLDLSSFLACTDVRVRTENVFVVIPVILTVPRT